MALRRYVSRSAQRSERRVRCVPKAHSLPACRLTRNLLAPPALAPLRFVRLPSAPALPIAGRVVIAGSANIIAALRIAALACSCAMALACAPPQPNPRSPPQSGAPGNRAAPSFVSLNPCLDAILIEVAAPEQILAISHYSHQPGGSSIAPQIAARYKATGGTAEEIIALAPDIVLASAFLPPATKAALERAGLVIETFDSPRTVTESQRQVLRLGKLTGDSWKAIGLSREMRFRLGPPLDTPPDPSRQGWEPAPDPSVLLWQPGQIVAGQNTLIAQLIREEGFTSHAAALGLDQADYVTLEHVLSDPPDVLLVAGDSAGQHHPALQDLKGTKVHYFDPGLFYCGGPSVSAARDELNALRLSFEDLGE